MTWFSHHLPKADGIEAAEERTLSTFFTCHKCGKQLGDGTALIVQYEAPDEERNGIREWEILCHPCKTELGRRLEPLTVPTRLGEAD